ncbi:glycosyltransferase [Aureimonas glaciei]|uniref:Glycosyl transferase n=1 Tax=Aureimonas glaciei TaxID=1776957 RepID=A0A916Y5M5_9HYPH|nr:glycosyltransferase [Aureimonas glaciei]GGD31818.1 glycosyl transferase [Aureimonas glaciei]
MGRVLYVSYDGMLEPLGQSQVLGYLEPLAATHAIHLVSFEKARDRRDPVRMQAMRDRLAATGVRWTPLRYHKSPSALATAFDIAVGQIVVLALALRHRSQILHARSYVPALIAMPAARLTGARFLFDIRGFWADERVDGDLWPRGGTLYRIAKRLERRFFRAADHVVTLTEASARLIERFDYLADHPPALTVIPTCADLGRFVPAATPPTGPFTFGYVGQFGTWYLLDEALSLFGAILRQKPDARMLVINRHEHAAIHAAAERAGIPLDRLELRGAEHRDVPAQIVRMHAASALIRPCYSKLSSSPTKLAEYLGCGVPCVGNIGVGDVEAILADNAVGVVMRGFSESDMDRAATAIIDLAADAGTASRCRGTAERLFSLDDGITQYASIYQRLKARGYGEAAQEA